MSNTFGKILRLTNFGESHGQAIGGVVDGFPANILIDIDYIQNELNKRRPGYSKISTRRKEPDTVNFVSGIFENKSTGAPIAFFIQNTNAKSSDYQDIKDIFRPGHSDYTYWRKYGIRDWRGGGRASARETAVRVAAGALAKLFLHKFNIKIYAFVSQIGKIKLKSPYYKLDLTKIYDSQVRCPEKETEKQMIAEIESAMRRGDSVGGAISCVVVGCPAGLGEPVFDKFDARLASAIMSINACKAFEIGKGFDVAQMLGSENNDQIFIENNQIKFSTNNAGGVLGGITTGQDIFFKAYFKPTPSISREQNTIDKNLKMRKIQTKGRHDPCIVPRAVAVVEAMTALTIADFILLNNANKF